MVDLTVEECPPLSRQFSLESLLDKCAHCKRDCQCLPNIQSEEATRTFVLRTLFLGHTVKVNLGQASSDCFSNGSIVWSAASSKVERRANWPRVVAASQWTACVLPLSSKQILRAWHEPHTMSWTVLVSAEVAHRHIALVVASRLIRISGKGRKVRVPVARRVTTKWCR